MSAANALGISAQPSIATQADSLYGGFLPDIAKPFTGAGSDVAFNGGVSVAGSLSAASLTFNQLPKTYNVASGGSVPSPIPLVSTYVLNIAVAVGSPQVNADMNLPLPATSAIVASLNSSTTGNYAVSATIVTGSPGFVAVNIWSTNGGNVSPATYTVVLKVIN